MKQNNWIRYLIITILILAVAYGGSCVFDVIRKNEIRTFHVNLFYDNFIQIIFYGSVGLLLGVEHLIVEIRKEGTWIINIPKLVLIGIPSLYFSLRLVIMFFNFNRFIYYPIRLLFNNGSSFIAIFQLILGYSIITSFYKINKKDDSIQKISTPRNAN